MAKDSQNVHPKEMFYSYNVLIYFFRETVIERKARRIFSRKSDVCSRSNE
jgi:hypothetical protein